jgi:hypothetical protein
MKIIHQRIGEERTWMNITQIHKWMDENHHQWIDGEVTWMNITRIHKWMDENNPSVER